MINKIVARVDEGPGRPLDSTDILLILKILLILSHVFSRNSWPFLSTAT